MSFKDYSNERKSAIKYKGKIYQGLTHWDVINNLMVKHGVNEKEIDNFPISAFGYMYNGKFHGKWAPENVKYKDGKSNSWTAN
jgi:hypothetical protein